MDNLCSIEFDPFGFSVKDLLTKTVLLRCNSSGALYTLCSPPQAQALLVATTTDLWHRRLGHPGHHTMSRLQQRQHIPPNKSSSTLCHACQLGRHVRLPFYSSMSFSIKPFQLLHCDLWTSPIPSPSGFCYYLIIVDDYTHYFWSFPLRKKSDVYATFLAFHAYAQTQFNLSILSIQCDNGHEFNNTKLDLFFSTNGILLRFSCPYTSQQNGKAERAIRTTNNVIRTLSFKPPCHHHSGLKL
uniref:Integrase catalytic domain-containing protein n=1 Tax=Triticum urartu TaxID=4572 RepID=A0A8R7QYA1_TRIUA